jgi:hypothetical protein
MSQSGVVAKTDLPAQPRPARRKQALQAAATVMVSLVLCLGIIELALRFMPVASGQRTMPVTANDPVFHYRPNHEFLFSRDWDMVLANRGRTNNAGFVNDQDYQREGLPMLAVVGDSYIEAAMVPFPDTVEGRLAQTLANRMRVYSFAASGAPLSQYLIWAAHAVDRYGATAVVINVVGNDFDESLEEYNDRPGFSRYVRDEHGELQLRRFEYRPGIWRDMVASSALARYLFFNLNLSTVWFQLRSLVLGSPAMAAPRFAGNTAADASDERVNSSLAAIDAFFRDLPRLVHLPPDRIAFTMDGFRYADAAADAGGTYFALMRRAFQAKAGALGYEVIDLDPWFFARHARDGARFEFMRDGHWNPVGHEVAAEALMSSRLLQSVLR